LQALRRQLRQTRQPQPEIDTVVEKLEALAQKIDQKSRQKTTSPDLTAPPLRAGVRVKLRSLKLEGVITSINEDDAEVMVGNLRVKLKTSDLVPVDEANPGIEKSKTAAPVPLPAPKPAATLFRPTPGMELDLRGMRAEDALDKLDAYLAEAYASGMPFVRIIHGRIQHVSVRMKKVGKKKGEKA